MRCSRVVFREATQQVLAKVAHDVQLTYHVYSRDRLPSERPRALGCAGSGGKRGGDVVWPHSRAVHPHEPGDAGNGERTTKSY